MEVPVYEGFDQELAAEHVQEAVAMRELAYAAVRLADMLCSSPARKDLWPFAYREATNLVTGIFRGLDLEKLQPWDTSVAARVVASKAAHLYAVFLTDAALHRYLGRPCPRAEVYRGELERDAISSPPVAVVYQDGSAVDQDGRIVSFLPLAFVGVGKDQLFTLVYRDGTPEDPVGVVPYWLKEIGFIVAKEHTDAADQEEIDDLPYG